MTFYAENEAEAVYPFDIDEILQNAIQAVLSFEHCPYEAEINLIITDEEGIRKYNRAYRNMDSVTDVLSFPAVDYPAPADFQIAESNKNSYFNPETQEIMLGDIILCNERVVSQAAEYGHSILREFTFLIVHSMLHLLGYDHMNQEDEEIMFLHQEKIMEKLGILR